MKNTLKLKLGAIAGALGTLGAALATHAQVTFDSAAPTAALTSVATGTTEFFYDNAPGVILTGVAVGIMLGLAGWLIRRLMARRSI